MSKITINQKNFNRFSKRLEKLFKEKTNGQELGHLEAQEFMSKILGLKNLHEFKKLMQNQEDKPQEIEEAYNPFEKDISNVDLDIQSTVNINNQSIVKPETLKVNLEAPYKKYKYLNDVWNNPSHGINVNNQNELNAFLQDVENSKSLWKNSGVYLGIILQAVEQNTVIDTGYPLGLVTEIDNYDRNELRHITVDEIKNFIELYKQYLTSEVVKNLDNICIEIKPFYGINTQQINYEVVEQNYNKRLKIK